MTALQECSDHHPSIAMVTEKAQALLSREEFHTMRTFLVEYDRWMQWRLWHVSLTFHWPGHSWIFLTDDDILATFS